MSLINEALRKAQNQRTPAPGLTDSSNAGNPPSSYADRPNRSGLMIGLSVCIVLLFGLVASLIVILLSEDKTPVVQQTASREPQALTPTIPEIAPQRPILEPTPEPIKTTTLIAETTKPVLELSTPEPPEKTLGIAALPEVTAQPDSKIVDWLAQSKVTGVRITNSTSKVILNNKGFIPGETVNMNLGLKVLVIEESRILFIDSNEVKYVKNL